MSNLVMITSSGWPTIWWTSEMRGALYSGRWMRLLLSAINCQGMTRVLSRLVKRRFKVSHTKTNVTPGADSLKLCFLEGSGHSLVPNASRLLEAAGQTVAGVRVNRWTSILRAYRTIRDVVLDSPRLMAETKLQLLQLNRQTLSQCNSNRFGMGTQPTSLTFLRMHRDRQCSVFEANPLQRLLSCLQQHNRSKASPLQSRRALNSLTQPTCFKLQTLKILMHLLLHLPVKR
ncbi:uncharacterized protein LOC130430332 isoform X2 [Triplophysa dalaica]|nr:uncharacterized protein LOC130430332 isoform X2 [Triplophysa dalaica]